MMKHRDSMNNGSPNVVVGATATRKSLKSAESNLPKTLVTFVTTNKSSSSDYCSDYFSGYEYENDGVSISSSTDHHVESDTAEKKTNRNRNSERNSNSTVRRNKNKNNNKESIGIKYSYVSSYYQKTIEDRSVSTEDIMYFSRYELDQKLDWTSNDSQSNSNSNRNSKSSVNTYESITNYRTYNKKQSSKNNKKDKKDKKNYTKKRKSVTPQKI